MLDYVVPSSFQQAQQAQQALEPRGLEYSNIRASKLRNFFFRARMMPPHPATASPQVANLLSFEIMKSYEIHRKPMKIYENLKKSMKIYENGCKHMKIYQNQ